MALPTSRAEFKDYILRRLGAPVIEINVSDEQIEDRIDDALKFYQDYHFDGTEKIYYKHVIQANNKADAVYDLTVVSGGSGYSNTDSVVFTSSQVGNGAIASIVTNANGVITAATLANNGGNYAIAPTVTVTSNTGTGASITSRLGGWIPIPENIIGAINVFPFGTSQSGTDHMFNIRYQIALNDLYSLINVSLVPYYMARQHLNVIEEVLIGQKPFRYNRHRNQLHLDVDWSSIDVGQFFIIEAYQVVDPNTFTDVWSDRWLLRYTTALVKKQWGEHLTKYILPMVGGVQFNGMAKLQEAMDEIEQLEEDMRLSYSLPSSMFIG